MFQDLKYALRQLRKSPGFTLTAVLTLALGTGVTAAVFSVIYAVMIQPLPYDHPETIVVPRTYRHRGISSPRLTLNTLIGEIKAILSRRLLRSIFSRGSISKDHQGLSPCI